MKSATEDQLSVLRLMDRNHWVLCQTPRKNERYYLANQHGQRVEFVHGRTARGLAIRELVQHSATSPSGVVIYRITLAGRIAVASTGKARA